jgi:hypothetical protein
VNGAIDPSEPVNREWHLVCRNLWEDVSAAVAHAVVGGVALRVANQYGTKGSSPYIKMKNSRFHVAANAGLTTSVVMETFGLGLRLATAFTADVH